MTESPIATVLDPFDAMRLRLPTRVPQRLTGTVTGLVGLAIEARGLSVPIGALCEVVRGRGKPVLPAEVVGFREGRAILLGHDVLEGVAPGDPVRLAYPVQEVAVGEALVGRVIDGRGRPVDGKGPLFLPARTPLHAPPPRPLDRRRITEPLGTGIKAIDTLLTVGKGQRVGLFAGSGVGKSVLLGMTSRGTSADVVVLALIGERGREVREFIERDLGPDGLSRAVVVVATSDEPPLVRIRAAFLATAVAEHFRDLGKDVLLLMDSVTRLAFAQREVGLSAGEPPASKGYPPSVFSLLPRLLERSGQGPCGSITGVYTVLVEGDDLTEPISDSVRSILDGHCALSRDLANRGHYPAIDTLASVSRCMVDVVDSGHRKAAQRVIALLAAYRDKEDMITIGAYVPGTAPEVDTAIRLKPRIDALLRQEIGERVAFLDAKAALLGLVAEAGG